MKTTWIAAACTAALLTSATVHADPIPDFQLGNITINAGENGNWGINNTGTNNAGIGNGSQGNQGINNGNIVMDETPSDGEARAANMNKL